MRRLGSWMFNAATRTLHTAFPGLASPDDEWARLVLEPAEFDLFMALPAAERAHAVKVGRCAQSRGHEVPQEVLKAALLHDVGKAGSSSHVVHRVIAHLLPAPEVPAQPRLRGLAGTRQAKRHHAAYGALKVLEITGDTRVAWLIRHHHQPGDDAWAQLIRACDEAT
ncbi:MAG TPA: HD domain-containing protein [Trueperaceae bacterium]